MNKLLLALVSMFFVVSLYTQDIRTPFERQLSVEEMAEDIRVLRSSLTHIHPGLYTYAEEAEVEQFFQTLQASASEPMTEMQFYHEVGLLMELIGDVHTDIEPSSAFYDLLNAEWALFPLSVIWLEEKLYVSHNLSSDTSIERGEEIESVNGIEADSLFKLLRRYVPRDGQNLTSPNAVLSGLYGGFRNYYASLFGHPDRFDLVLKSEHGQERSVTVDAERYEVIFERARPFQLSDKRRDNQQLSFSIDGDIAVMTVRSFHPGKIRAYGQKHRRFFAKAFRSLERSGIGSLVLDVRGNGGGHESVFMELFSYLCSEPFITYEELSAITQTIPHPEHFVDAEEVVALEMEATNLVEGPAGRWLVADDPSLLPFEPQQPHFSGALYVLIDGRSSSATGDFAGLLRKHQRAVFVGEELGGNSWRNTAGATLTLELPHSRINVIIPTLLYVIDTATPNNGRGLMPDHNISRDIRAYLEQEDPALDFIVEHLLSIEGTN